MTEGRRGVLVAGAINTDLVARVRKAPEAGETVTGLAFNVFGGGKGANQALSSARSGAATTMLGALGSDDFGAARLADLRADGIDVESVAVLDEAASGVALITVESSGQNRIAYVPGATMNVTTNQAIAAFDRARPAIVLSTLELPHQALKTLFERARSSGTTVVMNATPEPAGGRELLPLADVLIVNETEANELLGRTGETNWAAIGNALREFGPRVVIITLGAAGAVALIDGQFVAIPAPRVDVIDTTGAGDAFCGALAARLADGADIERAIEAGVAAGSLAVTIEGAQRSMPTRDRIDELMTSDAWTDCRE